MCLSLSRESTTAKVVASVLTHFKSLAPTAVDAQVRRHSLYYISVHNNIKEYIYMFIYIYMCYVFIMFSVCLCVFQEWSKVAK